MKRMKYTIHSKKFFFIFFLLIYAPGGRLSRKNFVYLHKIVCYD